MNLLLWMNDVCFDAPEHVKETLMRYVSSAWIAHQRAANVSWSDRVLVVGPRGAGKSVSLRWLAARFDGPVVHVDAVQANADVAVTDDDGTANSAQAPHVWLDATLERVRHACAAGSSSSSSSSGAALLLVDNVDAVALRRRGRDAGSRRVCVHFLALLDALATLNVGVVAATSDANACDPAALRHGRFAHRVELRAPLPEHAQAILRRRLVRLFPADSVDVGDTELLLTEAVARSKGLVGAQLEQLVDNAALGALRASPVFQFASFAAALRAELPIAADAAVRDVAPPLLRGVDELWRQLFVAVVEPLRDWPAFARLGAVRTDGVLLHGPSGCGKSSLVVALARAAALPLITVRGPELIRAEIGASEQLVRKAFAEARSKAPCLLLIDQIDAIARSRDDASAASAEGTSTRVLGCLLTEMDGLVQRDDATSFVVLATTNRVDLVDRAILRPGRFDMLLPVPFPERAAREEILRLHFEALHYGDDAAERERLIAWAARSIAAATPIATSSAALAAVAREAGMNSLRRHIGADGGRVRAHVVAQDIVDAAREQLKMNLQL